MDEVLEEAYDEALDVFSDALSEANKELKDAEPDDSKRLDLLIDALEQIIREDLGEIALKRLRNKLNT